MPGFLISKDSYAFVESGEPYYAAGNTAFADLPTLSTDILGATYTVTNSFTTDSRFKEGAGVTCSAGTKVAVVNIGTIANPVLKFDTIRYSSSGGGESWITDIPENHRNIFRGQSLGSALTNAQKAAIADGSFDDLYIGDYWTINGVNWLIADENYLYGIGQEIDTAAGNHLIIIPDRGLKNGAYSTDFTDVNALFDAAFPNMRMSVTFQSSENSGNYSTITTGIPSMAMLTGDSSSSLGSYSTSVMKRQFALFRLVPSYAWHIINNEFYWISPTNVITSSGKIFTVPTSESWHHRPFFIMGVTEESA